MAQAPVIRALHEAQIPGLYELVPEQPAPSALRTDTTAFLGLCASGPVERPTVVESWGDFRRLFGAPGAGRLLPQAVHAFFLHGGRRAVIVRADEEGGSPERAGILRGLEALAAFDEHQQSSPIALLCAPDLLHIEEPRLAPTEDQAHVSEDLRFREACLPASIARTPARSSRYPWLAAPAALTELLPLFKQLRDFANERRAMALIDLPPELDSASLARIHAELTSPRVALYAPWLVVGPAEEPGGPALRLPPSGVVAGQIAALELRHGPWRAPANLPLRAGFAVYRDPYLPSPAVLFEERVNLIRETPKGPTLLGARTTAADPDWLHIGTRRLVDWLCGQLALDLQWAAFEPHNSRLERKVLFCVNRRLDALFQANALSSASRATACFARCVPGTEGSLVVEVGVAPAIPAEFLVFRLGLVRDGVVEVLDG